MIKQLKANKKTIFIIGIMIVVFSFLAGLFILWIGGADASPVTHLKNVFIDVNGDGLIDYVKFAEVIINTGNFPVGP